MYIYIYIERERGQGKGVPKKGRRCGSEGERVRPISLLTLSLLRLLDSNFPGNPLWT